MYVDYELIYLWAIFAKILEAEISNKKKITNRYEAFGNVVRVSGARYRVKPTTNRARSIRPGCRVYCFMF